jgi:hypothetical protein
MDSVEGLRYCRRRVVVDDDAATVGHWIVNRTLAYCLPDVVPEPDVGTTVGDVSGAPTTDDPPPPHPATSAASPKALSAMVVRYGNCRIADP